MTRKTSAIPATSRSSSGTGTVHAPQVTPGLKRWRIQAGTSEVPEDRPPHRVDRVGQRVDPGQQVQPRRQPRQREQRAGQEQHRHQEELRDGHERLDLMRPARHHQADAREHQREEEQLDDEGEQQPRVVRDTDGSGEEQEQGAGDRRHRGAAERLADHDRGPAHRRHQHLAEEPEPVDRDHRLPNIGIRGGHRARSAERMNEELFSPLDPGERDELRTLLLKALSPMSAR